MALFSRQQQQNATCCSPGPSTRSSPPFIWRSILSAAGGCRLFLYCCGVLRCGFGRRRVDAAASLLLTFPGGLCRSCARAGSGSLLSMEVVHTKWLCRAFLAPPTAGGIPARTSLPFILPFTTTRRVILTRGETRQLALPVLLPPGDARLLPSATFTTCRTNEHASAVLPAAACWGCAVRHRTAFTAGCLRTFWITRTTGGSAFARTACHCPVLSVYLYLAAVDHCRATRLPSCVHSLRRWRRVRGGMAGDAVAAHRLWAGSDDAA